MRRASFRKAVKGRQVCNTHSLPAPVGGWNARDSVAAMDEKDALVLKNIFPETNDVRVRKGQSQHATGIGAQVESLMPYNAQDGTQTLFAAADTSIYDVTATGAVGAAVVSSMSNARWQYVNFTNSSGTSYLCCYNGEDEPQYWNGSTWISIDGSSTPAITGVTTTNLVSAAIHQRRMWLVEVDTLTAWYLDPDSVGGAANDFSLGGIASKGGYLMAISTWTVDAGAGLDDYWVAITSEGQLIIYRGIDPSSASSWELVGVWNVGEPLGRRCFCKLEGDLLLITVNGVISLARVMTGRTNQRAALTDKIQSAMTSAAALYRDNFGWELLYYPQANMLLLNVPAAASGKQEQYAMNVITGAWGRFTGVEASCWAIFDKEPYFGGNGTVSQFWDDEDDDGANIGFEERQAYSYLRARGLLKQVRNVRPSILASGAFEILMGINVDFAGMEIQGAVSFSPPVYGLWDTGLWDDALWGGGLVSFNDWQTVDAIGTAISIGMKGAIQGFEFRHEATDIVYERGGVIA